MALTSFKRKKKQRKGRSIGKVAAITIFSLKKAALVAFNGKQVAFTAVIRKEQQC